MTTSLLLLKSSNEVSEMVEMVGNESRFKYATILHDRG